MTAEKWVPPTDPPNPIFSGPEGRARAAKLRHGYGLCTTELRKGLSAREIDTALEDARQDGSNIDKLRPILKSGYQVRPYLKADF